MLRYLSRYTHRVAISNRRLIAADDAGVAFRWKDYCADGPARWKTKRLHPHAAAEMPIALFQAPLPTPIQVALRPHRAHHHR